MYAKPVPFFFFEWKSNVHAENVQTWNRRTYVNRLQVVGKEKGRPNTTRYAHKHTLRLMQGMSGRVAVLLKFNAIGCFDILILHKLLTHLFCWMGSLVFHAILIPWVYNHEALSIDQLQLADASRITMLPNNEIIEGMGQMGSKSGGWDQFGSNIATTLICLSTSRTENKHPYLAVTLTKKIFGNMKRGFRGALRPLLPAMLLVATTNLSAGQEHPDVAQSQPSSSIIPVPSTSSPPVQSPPPIPAPIPTPTPTPTPTPIPTPIPDTNTKPLEHTFEEPSPAHQHFSPPQEHVQGQMTVDDLLRLVPQLVTRIDSLETDLKQTKLTMGSAIVKLVKKVKKLEGILKRRNVDLSDFEEEELEAQGRKISISGQVSTDSTKKSIPSPEKGQREGKAPMIIEEAPKKTKEQLLQEEASLAEAIRLDTLQKEEEAKQHYTDEDWDPIKAKIEANDESEASKDADPISDTDIPIHPVPLAKKPPSIATYKIIKQGEKGVYQIVREDGTDIVYINFRAMLKDITRDDLTELYRIVMNRYGMNGLEDELEKTFWKYLKNMFEPPLSTDLIWSLLGQQRIISWRYYDTCRVHCLNLESMDIYVLIERKYPLSAEVCKAMLDKKLQGGKPYENCYKMLKMMEKQASIRK
ncbi:hypothetical protein Tco_0516856 [Tanacetum coccineum]